MIIWAQEMQSACVYKSLSDISFRYGMCQNYKWRTYLTLCLEIVTRVVYLRVYALILRHKPTRLETEYGLSRVSYPHLWTGWGA